LAEEMGAGLGECALLFGGLPGWALCSGAESGGKAGEGRLTP
jgi:hypothetical protein